MIGELKSVKQELQEAQAVLQRLENRLQQLQDGLDFSPETVDGFAKPCGYGKQYVHRWTENSHRSVYSQYLQKWQNKEGVEVTGKLAQSMDDLWRDGTFCVGRIESHPERKTD